MTLYFYNYTHRIEIEYHTHRLFYSISKRQSCINYNHFFLRDVPKKKKKKKGQRQAIQSRIIKKIDQNHTNIRIQRITAVMTLISQRISH